MTNNIITPPVRVVFDKIPREEKPTETIYRTHAIMTKEPDTINLPEFLLSSAVKWQEHARKSFMMVEITRDNQTWFGHRDIIGAQLCSAAESKMARERLFTYMAMKG